MSLLHDGLRNPRGCASLVHLATGFYRCSNEVTGGAMAHKWKKSRVGRVVAMGLLSLVIAACATTTRNATSVVDYLYLDSNNPQRPRAPVLSLRVRVGNALSPADSSASTSGTSRAGTPLNLRS